jgi:hypothetical protein
MSDTVNLYESPQAPVAPEKTLGAQSALTDTMLRYIREASPWLRFIGILGFIGCGFIMLMGIAMTVTMSSLEEAFSGFGSFSTFFGESFGAAFSASIGVVYIIAAVLSFFPAYFTYIFGSKIRAYIQSGADQELELAFKNNKSLWKFNGILSIVGLAFIPVLTVIVVIVTVASVLGG